MVSAGVGRETVLIRGKQLVPTQQATSWTMNWGFRGAMLHFRASIEVQPRDRQKCGSIWRRLRYRQFECLAGHALVVRDRSSSLARDPSSSGNFASSSASEIPNAPAVALFGAPNAVIARTKRRSASPKFEAHFSAASPASAPLSASTRGVISLRFRPEPGLAPPRPIPLDFVISNPLNFQTL